MTMLLIFLKSLLIGLSIAAAIGPISILCFRIGLTKGLRSSVLAGLGAATADAIYGLLAVFGLSGFLAMLQNYSLLNIPLEDILQIGGGIFIGWLGWSIVKSSRNPNISGAADGENKSNITHHGFLSIFLLTLSNPMTILSFAAIFAGLGVAGDYVFGEKITAVSGIFIGSTIWWFILGYISAHVGKSLSPTRLRKINIASGLILLFFSTAIFVSYAL
ncbi:MAG: LysE family transporter [Alphaproteobacteria bacterium]|nr:LysE family transporter [Alphaproteobacteria bacterium]